MNLDTLKDPEQSRRSAWLYTTVLSGAAVFGALQLLLPVKSSADAAIQPLLLNEEPLPPSLKTLEPIKPTHLGEYVRDEAAAVTLGKALFWDMQVGSDGRMACATCHFHAGADPRRLNQINPGLKAGDTLFGNSAVPGARGFPQFKPNYLLELSDFPLHQRRDPERQASRVTRDTNDVVSSQGVILREFSAIMPGSAEDAGLTLHDPVFHITIGRGRNARPENVRRVVPVNAPSVINAVFNFTNFVDGRANHFFNGVNPFGPADRAAGVWVNENGELLFKRLDGEPDGLPFLDFASLASQATTPPVSDIEMSWRGRTWADIGRKMLGLRPLGQQRVHREDSVLGNYAVEDGTGLTISYAELIQTAFHPRFWDSSSDPTGSNGEIGTLSGSPGNDRRSGGSGAHAGEARSVIRLDTGNARRKEADGQDPRTFTLDSGTGEVAELEVGMVLADNEFELMEANFALFFGLAVQLYQATLISDDAPYDRFQEGDGSALNASARRGLEIFVNQGRCIQCHSGALFTNHGIDALLALDEPGGLPELIERMGMAQGEAFYDGGFYNIGVRPTAEDIGRGGTTPGFLTNPADENAPFPLSFSRLAVLKEEGRLPEWLAPFTPSLPGNPGSLDRTAVDGSQRTPGLRNVELTGPYLRNGDAATLMQVVDFYVRGGNFPNANIDDLDPFIGEIPFLQNNEQGKRDLVEFMLALTDERVKYARAPFDHPQLFVPQGHDEATGEDLVMEIPEVGAAGRELPLQPFLNADHFQP